jgi:hypothetical protein
VHRAEIPDESRQFIEEIFGPSDRDKAQQRASNVLRLFGFGVPKIDEVIGCIESRATLWGYGSLGQDDARVFRLPLPASLADRRCPRSVSVALAWFTPITPGRRAYRSVRLIVEEPERLDLIATKPKPGQPDRKRVERGTLFTRTWIGTAPRSFAEGDQLELRVARKPDPFYDLPDSVEFALVVTLEAEASLPIYEEVKAPLAVKPAIAIPVPVRPAP